MFFDWLTNRRRRRLLARPFPPEWETYLRQNVSHYSRLDELEQAKLCGDLAILIAEKNWEGCRGLEINDEIKVTIAAQASLLTLGLTDQHFDMLQSVLVYPNAYVADGQTITKGGLVLEGKSNRQGEAWYRGPVVFSWSDALAGGRDDADGHNLVLHEFAHQLDMQNGRVIDGTPDLSSEIEYDHWQQVIQSEYRQLQHDCEQGHHTLLDCYGTTHIGEFFAVSTECFFERPKQMCKRHPNLYDILQNYFHQDPAARPDR